MPTVGVPLGPGGGGPLLHGLRLGDRRRRPATVLQILPLAAVDVRLQALLSRPLKVALAAAAASLKRFGWQQAIVADPKGVIVAGETRYKAAVLIGWTAAPVVTIPDVS